MLGNNRNLNLFFLLSFENLCIIFALYFLIILRSMVSETEGKGAISWQSSTAVMYTASFAKH